MVVQSSRMDHGEENIRSRISWPGFCFCLCALFIVRGLMLLCLYPPLEGFDEHQHIAYLAYANENRDAPRYGVSRMPKSLYSDFAQNPNPVYGCEQLAAIGALPYSRFWAEPKNVRYNADVMLYSAFYHPLYYRAVGPLYGFLRSRTDFRFAVYAIRMLNIFFAGLSILFFTLPFRALFESERFSRLTALAASLVPIYLVYVARAGSDAAALLTCSLIFFLLARMADGRALRLKALTIGVLLGVGSMVRVSVLSFLPISVLFCVFLPSVHGVGTRQRLWCVCVLLVSFVAVSYRGFVWDMRTYGMILPGQESLAIAREGKSLFSILGAARFPHLWTFFVKKMIFSNLWTSGWSFLPVPRLFHAVFAFIVLLCVGGGIAGLARCMNRVGEPACRRAGELESAMSPPRRFAHSPARSIQWPGRQLAILCALTWVMVCGGAYLHGLSSLVAYRSVIYSPSYYAMPGFLPLLGLMLMMLRGYGSRRLWRVMVGILIATFLITEWYCLLFIAAPYWAQASAVRDIYSRLASIHPAFPAPLFFLPLGAVYLAILAVVLRSAAGSTSRS